MSRLRIQRSHWEDIVAHARAEAPNECCGMLGAVDGRTVAVHRARNEDPASGLGPSPFRYVVHPADLHRILTAIDDAGQDLVIYHSHTRSAPEPSGMDKRYAGNYPGAIQVIVGVKDPEPDVRAWLIDGAAVTPVELLVD